MKLNPTYCRLVAASVVTLSATLLTPAAAATAAPATACIPGSPNCSPPPPVCISNPTSLPSTALQPLTTMSGAELSATATLFRQYNSDKTLCQWEVEIDYLVDNRTGTSAIVVSASAQVNDGSTSRITPWLSAPSVAVGQTATLRQVSPGPATSFAPRYR